MIQTGIFGFFRFEAASAMTRYLALLSVLTLMLTASASAQDEDLFAAIKHNIAVEAPWAVSVNGQVFVFMTIHNSGPVDVLTAVKSEFGGAGRIAKFSSAFNTPTNLDKLTIPGGGSVVLDQSGYHLSFRDLRATLYNGDRIVVDLSFVAAGDVQVAASVAVLD